ncbi:hypothetical protein [Chryseobacterium sp. SIMBA_038]|uniref:hypothetical protein n=1 Tax=Chryseobacterium sp. SIMBA_038 TaxID=3085780 RepID=UPI00397B10C5
MKKITTTFTLIISMAAFSQVGIKTANPHTSSDLELGSTNKTLYLNRVTNPAADIASPQPGMILFDTTNKCLRAYQGTPAAWSGCLDGSNGVVTGIITSLLCNSAKATPAAATNGSAYNGPIEVPYTGGNGGYFAAQSIASTGVTGLTATLPAGVFATGNGTLTFTVTGTPTSTGNALFAITIGGQSCTVSLPVNASTTGVLPGTVALVQNSRYWIASVYDNDYMPYTAPTGPATTARPVNADGTTELLVDAQGSITTTGITVYIPTTVTGVGGTVAAYSNTITIPANFTEDGISRQLELSWASQSITTSSPALVATIKAIGGTLNARKLDINAGIGNNYLGVLMGTFVYPYNAAGTLTNYEVRDIPGIPDRMFGQIDNAGKYQHNFLYLPVQAEDGKIWLNNNLGANYTNIDHPSFNLTQQATSTTDVNAMGSLLQWGRKADGHELMERNISGSSYGTFKYGVVYGQVATWSPTYPYRIFSTPNHVPSEWTSITVPPAGNRWLPSSPNNPCPQGFKVPVKAEWDAEITAAGSGGIYSATKKLKLTYAGEGFDDAVIFNPTVPVYSVADGYNGTQTYTLMNNSVVGPNIGNAEVDKAKSVRCIQE